MYARLWTFRNKLLALPVLSLQRTALSRLERGTVVPLPASAAPAPRRPSHAAADETPRKAVPRAVQCGGGPPPQTPRESVFGGVFAQRQFSRCSARAHPLRTTPPTEACTIHSKQRWGCGVQVPGTRGYRRWKAAASSHSAGAAQAQRTVRPLPRHQFSRSTGHAMDMRDSQRGSHPSSLPHPYVQSNVPSWGTHMTTKCVRHDTVHLGCKSWHSGHTPVCSFALLHYQAESQRY